MYCWAGLFYKYLAKVKKEADIASAGYGATERVKPVSALWSSVET